MSNEKFDIDRALDHARIFETLVYTRDRNIRRVRRGHRFFQSKILARDIAFRLFIEDREIDQLYAAVHDDPSMPDPGVIFSTTLLRELQVLCDYYGASEVTVRRLRAVLRAGIELLDAIEGKAEQDELDRKDQAEAELERKAADTPDPTPDPLP